VRARHFLIGHHRFVTLDGHERHNISAHAYDGLIEPVEMHHGERPILTVVRFRSHCEPGKRQQARVPAQVPHLDHALRGHGVQVSVDRVVRYALHAPAMAQQRGAVHGARHLAGDVPQPHSPVHAASGQVRVTDRAHAREPHQV